MKPSIEAKLDRLSERHEEIKHLLSDSGVITDNKRFMTLSKEYAELEPVVLCFHKYTKAMAQKEENKNFLTDADVDIRQMAEEEMGNLDKIIEQCEAELQILLLPKDPNDTKNTFLEIRAGTGGDEAAIFAGNLFRMYSRYAERMHWKIEVISESLGEHGGYKEVIARVIGENVYSNLKFESGAHRVQRVPTTESQGRVHTSACTVAIMPEVDDVEEVNIDPSELRIDTYKASGAGGQHVNKTDSAIRITHIPTGLVVESQEERSQHKNRAKAMSLLQSRLKQSQIDKQNQEQATTRRNLVGSGDRSERIRTYNFPQGRLTDHRINLTLYKLDEIMEGGLDDVIGPLRREHQTDLLASMGD